MTRKWDDVDWRLTNWEIHRFYGIPLSTVRNKRRLLGKPLPDKINGAHLLPSDIKQAKKKWHLVDWSKSNGEIARDLSTTERLVAQYRIKRIKDNGYDG